VALHILEANGRRLRDAETRLEDLAFKGVSARMAGLLLRLAEETGPEANVIEGFTHLDLAESIGTYRETATQVLNDFKSAGLIEISRKRILIIDSKGLASIDVE
jgi:CRP-like cAMP-binding protein